jgi:hypothetical protein
MKQLYSMVKKVNIRMHRTIRKHGDDDGDDDGTDDGKSGGGSSRDDDDDSSKHVEAKVHPGQYVDVKDIVNGKVPITNDREKQFWGHIYVGTPPQRVSVIFDTGSGELVVRSTVCRDCQGTKKGGYNRRRSSTAIVMRGDQYHTAYGSGASAGAYVKDTVRV